MPRKTRRTILTGLAAALAGCQTPTPPSTPSGTPTDGGGGTGTPTDSPTDTATDTPAPEPATLNRFAITAAGAEVTGLFLGPARTLFMNVQHPSGGNPDPYDDPVVGVFSKPLRDLPRDFESVQNPAGTETSVATAWGDYQVLAAGRDETADGEQLGVAYSPDGTPLTDASMPDANVYVPDNSASGAGGSAGSGGDAGYLFTNWETRPGMLSRLRVSRPAPGEPWTVERAENLDVRGMAGTWRNCFGTRSPWGTPLSAEELYYQHTARWNSPDPGAGVERLAAYLGAYPNPYRYGYIVEVTEPTSSSPTPVKQFAMGRANHENAVVMADERTAYLTDDGTGTVLFKFVADEPGDLSAGTLYAAKAAQEGSGDLSEVAFRIEWVELAHATRAEVESWIAEYDDVTQADYEAGATSYISDAEIQAWANGNAPDDRAAFLESRKAAAAAGATAEFRKMEGINARPGAGPGDSLYVAMSRVSRTMSDDDGDLQAPYNAYGAVYRMPIEQGYDVSYMEPAIVGGTNATVCGGCPYDARPDSSATCATCSYNPQREDTSTFRLSTDYTVANPDNVVVMDDGRVVVGEDTGLKDNDMVWVYAPPG